MTNRFISKCLAGIVAFSMCITPITAYAADNNYLEVKENDGEIATNYSKIETNNGSVESNGTHDDHNTQVITTNNGEVTDNYAAVTTNGEEGTIVTNQSSGTVVTNEGEIEKNYGTVTTNEGTIDYTSNKVTTNEGTIKSTGYSSNIGTNGEDGVIEKNSGVVNDNEGTIKQNIVNGPPGSTNVYVNNGTIETNCEGANVGTNNDTVATNNGNVGTNEGTVETNNGKVTTNNKTIEENSETGNIGENHGIVKTNNSVGQNAINKNYGEVTDNNGVVAYNNNGGVVTNNEGTVLYNDGGEVVNNNGDIQSNHGVIDNNFGNIGHNWTRVINNFGGIIEEGNQALNEFFEFIIGDGGEAFANNSDTIKKVGDKTWVGTSQDNKENVKLTVKANDGKKLDKVTDEQGNTVDATDNGDGTWTVIGAMKKIFFSWANKTAPKPKPNPNPAPTPDPQPDPSPSPDPWVAPVSNAASTFDAAQLINATQKASKTSILVVVDDLTNEEMQLVASFLSGVTSVKGNTVEYKVINSKKLTVTDIASASFVLRVSKLGSQKAANAKSFNLWLVDSDEFTSNNSNFYINVNEDSAKAAEAGKLFAKLF